MRFLLFLAMLALLALAAEAQRLAVADNVKGFVSVDAPVVALTNVRVIDGTGAPARANQTIVIQDGNIAEVVYLTRTADVPMAGLNVRRVANFQLTTGGLIELGHTDYPYTP